MRATDVGGQVVAVDPPRRRPARRHDVVVGRVAPAHRHPRCAQRERGGGEAACLGELALAGHAGQAVEDVGGAQREPHRAAVLEGGEVRRRGLVEVAEADQRPTEQQPRLDAVAPEPGGVGQRHHVGGETRGLAQLAAVQQVASVLREHREPYGPGQALPVDRGGLPGGVEPAQEGLGQQADPVLGELAGLDHHRTGARHGLRDAALLQRDAGQEGAGGEVDPALVAAHPRRQRVAGRLGGLGEPALGGEDVGEGAGGLSSDRALGVEVERPPRLALGELHLAGVEVHLGPDGGRLRQLLLRPRGRRRVLVGAVEQPEALVGAAHLGGRDPGAPGDLRADRRRTVAARHGGLEDLDGVTRAHRGVERGEDPVGDRVALVARLRLRARGEHRVPHRRQVLEPVGVGGSVVVVLGGVLVGPREQAGLDGRHVLGQREGAGAPADGGEHVEAAVGVDLGEAAAHEVAGDLGGALRGLVEHAGKHAESDGEAEQADPAQRGGAVVVEQVVGGVDGLVEADGGHRVAQPDERRLHGDLLDEERQSTGGPQQAAYFPVLLGEVDGLGRPRPGSGAGTARRRGPRAASGARARGAGRPGRPTRRAGRPWPARSPRRGHRSCRPACPGASAPPRSRRGRARRAPAGSRGRRRRGPGHR